VFDLRRDNEAVVEVFDNYISGRLIAGNNPLELIENYTAITGRMRPLPDWVTRGAIFPFIKLFFAYQRKAVGAATVCLKY
jgi:hypothetical protein